MAFSDAEFILCRKFHIASTNIETLSKSIIGYGLTSVSFYKWAFVALKSQRDAKHISPV